jgi:protein-tyrosine phosphatase
MREFFGAPGAKEIPDPFGGPLKIYEVCRDEMVEAIPSLIDFLKTQVAGKSA